MTSYERGNFNEWFAWFRPTSRGGHQQVGILETESPERPRTLLALEITRGDPQEKWAWYATVSSEGWKGTRNSGPIFDSAVEAAIALKQVIDATGVRIAHELAAVMVLRDIATAADQATKDRSSFASAPTPA